MISFAKVNFQKKDGTVRKGTNRKDQDPLN